MFSSNSFIVLSMYVCVCDPSLFNFCICCDTDWGSFFICGYPVLITMVEEDFSFPVGLLSFSLLRTS